MSSNPNSITGTGRPRERTRLMTVARPEVSCRSHWLTSPFTTTVQSSPMRVRNVLISAGVAFCASSSRTNALFHERPRITSNGTNSMSPRLTAIL